MTEHEHNDGHVTPPSEPESSLPPSTVQPPPAPPLSSAEAPVPAIEIVDTQRLFELAMQAPKHKPHVDEIIVKGNDRTKTEIILRELEILRAASSLAELRDAALHAEGRLRALGCFKGAHISFDEGPADDAGSVTAVVTVKEKEKWLGYRAQTYVTRGAEKGVEAAVKYSNLTGHADSIEALVTASSARNVSYTAQYANPTALKGTAVLRARIFDASDSRQATASHTVESRGVAASLSGANSNSSNSNSAEAQLAWTRLHDPSGTASRAIRAQLGSSLKASLSHTFRGAWELGLPAVGATAAHRFLAGTAFAARSQTEGGVIWGRGASLPFLRAQGFVRGSYPLGRGLQGTDAPEFLKGLRLEAAAEAGAFVPLSSASAPPPTLSERFHLGGIPSLRGFRQGCVGPAAQRRVAVSDPATSSPPSPSPSSPLGCIGTTHDALGLDFYAAGHVALVAPVQVDPLRALGGCVQVYADAAAGGVRRPGEKIGTLLSDAASQWRASVGVGLLFPLAIGTVEVGVSRVVKKGAFDQEAGRFELGVSSIGV